MTDTIRISEVFLSIEGEGPYTGYPTIFVRTFGCNFTCTGFNNPTQAPLTFERADSLQKVKLSAGCDSAYSWHPAFKNLARDYTIQELADEIYGLYEHVRKREGIRMPILCFTGGEPMLWQTQIAALLNLLDSTEDLDDVPTKILFETNCTIPVGEDLYYALMPYDVVWANSPKLSISGEPWSKAIRPEVLKTQRPAQMRVEHYLKFVSDGSDESFAEIDLAVRELAGHDSYRYSKLLDVTWVMPVGTTSNQQNLTQRKVAEQCLARGLKFCARVHCFVFDNEPGT